jgi:hypothetical protein
MYMRESRKEVPVMPVPFALRLALVACLVATIYLGIFPNSTLQYAQDSAQRLVWQSSFAPVSAEPGTAGTVVKIVKSGI